LEEQREREKAEREMEEVREKMKRDVEDEDDEIRGRKSGKVKKRKDRSSVRDERPLVHGAHGLVKQDGLDVLMEGTLRPFSPSSVRQARNALGPFHPPFVAYVI
jgi:transcriptional adapter 3